MLKSIHLFKAYLFPLLLLLSIVAGGVTGYFLGEKSAWLKPIGEFFLNLLFVAIVPLIFFSIAASVARLGEAKQLGRLVSIMFATFLFTGVVAAIFMLAVVILFPPAQNVVVPLNLAAAPAANLNLASQFVASLTVSDFSKLFSHQHIFPLVIFSALAGFAAAHSGGREKLFAQFLQAGAEVFMRVIALIMYLAPIGFFAYFAVIVAELGPKILESYVRVLSIYSCAAFIYFVLGFTVYAYLAGQKLGVQKFWKNIFLPIVTSLATCSSAASIPANLQAAKDTGISPPIYETVVPVGAILHKDGSVLAGMVKIAFLFGVFHLPFAGVNVFFIAIVISLLVGIVMGAIPSGGMLGEMLILSFYGFPPQALVIIAAISILVDPLATMLNVTGDVVSSMMISRFIEGRAWLKEKCAALAAA